MDQYATVKSLIKIAQSTKLTEPVIFCKKKVTESADTDYYGLLPDHLARLLSHLYGDVNFVPWEEMEIPEYEIIFDSRFAKN